MCVTHTYMNTYNVCDTYMGEQGARSILALVQIGLLAQASTPAVVAVALTMIMVGMVVMMVKVVMMMVMVVMIMAGMMWMMSIKRRRRRGTKSLKQ